MWWPGLASGFLLPTLAFCFCATFPRPLFRDRRIWALALAPTSLFVFSALPGFFYATFVHPGVYLTTMDPNTLPRIGGSILLAYIAAALVALVVNYRRLDLAERRRLRVLVAGTVVGWGATLLLLLLFPFAGRALTQTTIHLLALVSAVLAFALPIAWSYAILRHRVFDISVILRQGLQYALARRVLVTVVPALGIVMLVDLLLHGQQPLLDILRARGWAYVGIGILAITATVQRQRWLIALDRRSRTLAIVRPISAALAAAHRRQLVHRDLKPENVFLAMGETGEIVKVLDFGLAKFVSAAAEQVTGLTGPGVIAGTPRYMSPEQWRGEQVRPAWDLWAAAVVSYELLAGVHPFAAAGAGNYARAVTSGTFTPLAAHVGDAPPQWQAFFERALSPTLGPRPQSADAFISELEMALT